MSARNSRALHCPFPFRAAKANRVHSHTTTAHNSRCTRSMMICGGIGAKILHRFSFSFLSPHSSLLFELQNSVLNMAPGEKACPMPQGMLFISEIHCRDA